MFEPYVAKGKSTARISYDLLIGDTVAKDWYDRSDVNDFREWVWCVNHLRPAMTVADCGAHHGCLSVVFAKAVGAKGRVYSFEALPRNAEIVARNFEINGCANGVAHAIALSDRVGAIKLASGDSGKTAYLSPSEKSIEVASSTLDAELPGGGCSSPKAVSDPPGIG